MEQIVIYKEEKYRKRRRFLKKWHRVLRVLSVIVVFCTTYALILPAITMEKKCQITEHIHVDSCYRQVVSISRSVPSCTLETLGLHQHEAGCYEGGEKALCGYADFVVHHHDDACFDDAGNFWCTLPEIEEYSHGDTCFSWPQLHTHGEDCYTDELGELTCTLHQHTDDCLTEQISVICGQEETAGHRHEDACRKRTDDLICGMEENDGHMHDETCLDENGEQICGEEEREGHHHSDSCYAWEAEFSCGMEESAGHTHDDSCLQKIRTLTCGVDSDHQHTEDCYNVKRVLSCGMEELQENAAAEPIQICGREEIILHSHEESCFDEHGFLVCGKTQVLQHQHGENCFVAEEVSVDTDNLTCTVPEGDGAHSHGEDCYDAEGVLICLMEESSGHQHTQRCYGSWELICQQQEHIHTEECTDSEETSTEETTTEETTTEETTAEETTETVPEELPLQENMSDKPTMGVAYAKSSSSNRRMVFRMMLADNGTGDDSGSEPQSVVNVESYIINVTLRYQLPGETIWNDVQGAQDIPGNASFELKVFYKNVPIDSLLSAECSMTYTLPDEFREVVTDGKIEDALKNPIGTISCDGRKATIVFDETWLQEQRTGTKDVIEGNFYVTCKLNLSQIPPGGNTIIKIGDVEINADFAGDLIAQYGTVNIQKTLLSAETGPNGEILPKIREEEDGDYLEYLLQVTAGEDGCPSVRVEDSFGAGSDFIARENGLLAVVVLEPENANVSADADKMIWTIGDMAPEQTAELRYRVKLVDSYTGIKSKGEIQNTATVFSDGYPRDEDAAIVHPKADGTVSKVGTSVTVNEDKSITVTYYVWVNALSHNSYTLDHVKIVDSLDGKGLRKKNPTDENIRKHLVYAENSFALYSGGVSGQNTTQGLVRLENQGELRWGEDSNADEKRNDSFTYYVGDLAPGESRTLVYQVIVEPGAFAVSGNADFYVKNRAEIMTDDSREDKDADPWLNGYNCNMSFAHKKWSRKVVGTELTEAQTITIGQWDSVLSNINGESISNPGTFTVPAGSYQYQVVANEAGDWNLSAANLVDNLDQYMRFVGYVRVDAYSVNGNAPASSLADEDAINYFRDATPCKTFWVYVDGLKSFKIAPGAVDNTHSGHAFVLTYYAQPVSVSGLSQVKVTNQFGITDTVGIGKYQYQEVGIYASADVILKGSNSFNAEKYDWYYERPQGTGDDFSKGAIYWLIKVDGNLLPAGTAIRDLTDRNNSAAHFIRGTSLVGVYTGNLGSDGISAYPDMSALRAARVLTELERGTDYKVSFKNPENIVTNYEMTVTLEKDISLESNDCLYIIVKTEPSEVLTDKRAYRTYKNSLQSSSDGNSWVDHAGATKMLYGSDSIFKELGVVIEYPGSGENYKTIQPERQSAIVTSELKGAGTYVAWQIHLNYEGNLQGTYRLLEEIPDGMKLAYIRTYWLGNHAVNQNPLPQAVQIQNPGSGWEEVSKTLSSANGREYTTYYYTNGQQVLMEYQNLQTGGNPDEYAVEIQVVCKLTDPDVLMGGSEKTFNNIVTLFNDAGDMIGRDNDGVKLKTTQMHKGKDETATVGSGRYPFVITLNELGTDLMPGEETVQLVDELGANLTVDTDSIKVKSGDQEITNWFSALEDETDGTQKMIITLPDNLPLTITYDAIVNALPNETVTISNNAYWKGYAVTDDSSVNDSDFSVSAGGTAGGDVSPRISVRKIDQYNNQLTLAGAEFNLTPMRLENGTFVEAQSDDDPVRTGTTGEDGMVTFGTSEPFLKYNTIYRIRETKAPQGYVLDSEASYVLMAREVTGEDGKPQYPDYAPQKAAGVYISLTPQYTYEAKNHKGEIRVEKHFTDAAGNAVNSVDGTYRFGLFKDQQATTKVQETYVQYKHGQLTSPAKFTNVELNTPYYVYELDDQNRPITDGVGTVSGIPFMVTGPQESITVTQSTPEADAVVTNCMDYDELPTTGGTGMETYFAGIVLMMAAVVLLYSLKSCRKEERASS